MLLFVCMVLTCAFCFSLQAERRPTTGQTAKHAEETSAGVHRSSEADITGDLQRDKATFEGDANHHLPTVRTRAQHGR